MKQSIELLFGLCFKKLVVYLLKLLTVLMNFLVVFDEISNCLKVEISSEFDLKY